MMRRRCTIALRGALRANNPIFEIEISSEATCVNAENHSMLAYLFLTGVRREIVAIVGVESQGTNLEHLPATRVNKAG